MPRESGGITRCVQLGRARRDRTRNSLLSASLRHVQPEDRAQVPATRADAARRGPARPGRRVPRCRVSGKVGKQLSRRLQRVGRPSELLVVIHEESEAAQLIEAWSQRLGSERARAARTPSGEGSTSRPSSEHRRPAARPGLRPELAQQR